MSYLVAPNSVISRVVRGGLLLLCSFLLVTAAGLLILRLHGLQLLSVQSASMQPTFDKGDALLVESAKISQVAVGQIVTIVRSGVVVSHRVISVDRPTNQIITRGDANATVDNPVTGEQLIGQPVAVAPGLGTFIDAAHTKIALVVGVYVPACMLLIAEIRRLAAAFERPHYTLPRPTAR